MKREFATIVFGENEAMGYAAGDQNAVQAALGLAQRCDAPTIIALTDAMAFLKRVGGQLHVVTLRRREGGEPEYRTEALLIQYESIDAKIEVVPGPRSVEGVPTAEFREPPTRIEGDTPEPPAVESTDGEQTVRDDIEDEADALDEEPVGTPVG